MGLIGYELELDVITDREAVVRALARNRSLLVLDTCQRLECFGQTPPHDGSRLRVSQTWENVEAFERLARIAAGLESRILGELEVLGQVRNAYKQFSGTQQPNARLDRIFQDALALARRARRESGIDAQLTSLSGIAARRLLDSIPKGAPLAVVGTGSLATSVARYLGRRGCSPVRVCSRCPENAVSLAGEVGGFGAGLDDIAHLFKDVAGIITATAAPHPVIYAHHLEATAKALTLIDMGVPQDCAEEARVLSHVTYLDLQAIEEKAQTNLQDRRRRATTAGEIIRDGALAWARSR